MKKRRLGNLNRSLFIYAAMTLMNPATLLGVDYTWIGTTSDLNDTNNWTPVGGPPTTGDTGIFNGTGSLTPTLTGFVFMSPLEFQVTGGSYAFDINGAFLSFGHEGTPGGGFVNTAGLMQRLEVSNDGQIFFSAQATVNSTLVDFVATAATVEFDNDVGAPSFTANFSIGDQAQLAVTGASSAGNSIITSTSLISFNGNTVGGNSQIILNSDVNSAGSLNVDAGNLEQATVTANGVSTILFDTSPCTAGTSSIIMNDSTNIQFAYQSSAGSSTITFNTNATGTMGNSGGTDTATLESSTLTLSDSSSLSFFANTTAGSATINFMSGTAGTFNDSSSAGAATINMAPTCTLTFNQVTDSSYSGSLSGAGSLEFNSNVNQLFTGNGSAFTGTTNLNGGTLKVNGSLGGTTSINNGTTLSGTGTLMDIIVNSGGTMAPGNSIGTMVVNGTYIQNAGSFYNVQINNAGQSTLINVTGPADLNGGTVQVIPLQMITTSQEYLILHSAGGVVGQFSGVTFANNFFVSSLVYDPNDVFLKLIASKTPFSPIAATKNQEQVAIQLEDLFNDAPDPSQQAFLNTLIPLTIPEIQRVLDLLSGVQYTSIFEVQRLANRRFLRQLYNPLRYDLAYTDCQCECDSQEGNIDIWTDFEGGRAFFEGNPNASGFSDYNYNATIGVQTRLNRDLIIGAAAGYEYDHLKYDLAGHGRVHTAQGALYGAFIQPDYYTFSDLSGGWSDFKIVRPIEYSTNSLTAFGNTHSYHATLYTEVGLNLDWSCFVIQPFVGIDVSYYRFNNILERGTGVVDLNIRGKNIVDSDGYVGMHLLTTLPQDFIVSTDLAWGYRFTKRDYLINAHFEGFGDEFAITGIDDGKNRLEGAINVAKTFCDTFTVYAEFSGEVWSHLTNYEGTLGLLVEW